MTLTQEQRTAMYCALSAGVDAYERFARDTPENAEFWRKKAVAARDAIAAFEQHFYGERPR
jgi:hypothetical protein